MGQQLGIILVPSPDPVSTAANVALAAMAAITRLNQMIGRGRREADILTGPQGAQTVVGSALDQLEEVWNRTPDSDPGALIKIRNEQQRVARDFEEFTYNFPRAGPGARGTILGIEKAGVWTPGEAPNEGWLSRQTERWDGRLKVVLGEFDFNRWVEMGFEVAERYLPAPRAGTEPYIIQTPRGPVLYDPTIGGGVDVWTDDPGPPPMPEWFYPALIGGAVLVGGSLLLKR